MTFNEILGLVMLGSMITVIFVGLPISYTLLFIALVFSGTAGRMSSFMNPQIWR